MSSRFTCVAELIVKQEASTDELGQLCETLGKRRDTTVLTVGSTRTGTKITCGIIDSDSFLSFLSDVPGLASWRLTTE